MCRPLKTLDDLVLHISPQLRSVKGSILIDVKSGEEVLRVGFVGHVEESIEFSEAELAVAVDVARLQLV